MKNALPVLVLIVAVISIACGRQTESITVPDFAAKSIAQDTDTLYWGAPDPGVDSVIGCHGKGLRSRYYSSFYIDYSAPFPGNGTGEDDSTWVLSFTMVVQLPGEFCLDTIPISAIAESNNGDSIPIVASVIPPQSRMSSVMLEIGVDLILPIHLDGTLNGGGLAIIVETIDPVTSFIPKLSEVSDWEGEVGSEIYEIPAEEVLGFEPRSPQLTPVQPSCAVCMPSLGAASR